MSGGKFHLAIVKSRYRPEIVGGLFSGAKAVLDEAGATYEAVEVSGSLEIPAAVSMLASSKKHKFDGFVALGCIMKGDTIHDEVIAYAVFADIDRMACDRHIAIGNGILTVNTLAQAEERADPKRQNRGGEAARAALSMAELKRKCAA